MRDLRCRCKDSEGNMGVPVGVPGTCGDSTNPFLQITHTQCTTPRPQNMLDNTNKEYRTQLPSKIQKTRNDALDTDGGAGYIRPFQNTSSSNVENINVSMTCGYTLEILRKSLSY